MSSLNEDKIKFSAWWREIEKEVIWVAQRYTSNRASAEDIAQDVAIASYQNIRNFANKEHFKRWAITRTRWLSIDTIRKIKVEYKQILNIIDIGAAGEQKDPLITRELFEAIRKLPENQRKVILGFLAGKTSEELAKDLGIETPTVRSHKRFAIRNLTTLLD